MLLLRHMEEDHFSPEEYHAGNRGPWIEATLQLDPESKLYVTIGSWIEATPQLGPGSKLRYNPGSDGAGSKLPCKWMILDPSYRTDQGAGICGFRR